MPKLNLKNELISPPTIVIPAYQRADKLQLRLNEILHWKKCIKVIISIDGPRKSANLNEKRRNDEVVSLAKSFTNKESRVIAKSWEVNYGVNHHAYRIFKWLSACEQDLIIIEDDVSVNDKALDYLTDQLGSNRVLAAAAHSLKEHSVAQPLSTRLTAFPTQWGVGLKSEVVKRYVNFYENPRIDYRVLRKIMNLSLGDTLTSHELRRLASWWYQHLNLCVRHGDYADALIQYCVYSLDSLYAVPQKSLIRDDAEINDERSLTPRRDLPMIGKCGQIPCEISKNEFRCSNCELAGSHINDATLRNIVGAAKYRMFNKYKHFF